MNKLYCLHCSYELDPSSIPRECPGCGIPIGTQKERESIAREQRNSENKVTGHFCLEGIVMNDIPLDEESFEIEDGFDFENFDDEEDDEDVRDYNPWED